MRAPFRRWLGGMLTGILLAACSAQPADAGRFGFGFRHKTQTIVPQSAPASVTYDTSIGASVDSNGFAALPLRIGAHNYFVKNGGSDANDCTASQNAATPKATVASAVGCVTAGVGDHVLLAEGSTFSEFIPYIGTGTKDGFSALYPTVIWSYDPADPTNSAKYGRGDQRAARPVLTAVAGTNVANQGPNFFVIRGLDFNPGNVSGGGLAFAADGTAGHGITYLLIENNLFRYTTLSLDGGGPSWQSLHVIVRNNSFYGMWSTGGITGGVYSAGTDGTTLEDNVFWHNGWNTSLTRDETGFADHNAYVTAGGATVFEHSYYLQTTTTNSIVRRNVSLDGGGDGGIMRGDGVLTENLFIDNPASVGLGGGPNYDTERPNGILASATYNAILGDDDVSSTHTLGWGINTTNGLPGTKVAYNLIVRSRNVNGPSMSGFSNNAPFNLPSFGEYQHNLMWNWVASSGQVYFATCGSFPTQCHSSYDYNNWDGAAAGTNTNSAGTVFANAYTASTFYSALGYASKTAFVNYLVAHPESHLQRAARSLLFTGYGMAPPTDLTAPTLTSPTASSPSPGNATIAVTTNEGNGALYYELLTTGTAPHPTQVKFGLSSTNAAATSPGSVSVISTGTKSVNLSGVPPGTYFAHFAQEDVASNKSAVATSASFTIASSGWTPSSLGASLFGWWTADQPSTVNTGSSNVWTAYAGTAGPMTQATVANRPTYTSGVKLSFDSTDELDTASAPTIYDAVAVITTNSSNATWRTLFWGVASHHQVLLESGTDRLGAFDNAGFNPSGSTIAASTTAIVHVRMDSSGHVFQSLNGGTLTAQIADFSGVTTVNRAINVVGSSSGGGQPIGDIKAVVITSGVLSSTDLDKTVGSLACEWGLQSLLPGGHPYKSTCP